MLVFTLKIVFKAHMLILIYLQTTFKKLLKKHNSIYYTLTESKLPFSSKRNKHKYNQQILTELPHDKTNNVAVRPAKTQISLGIRPVWSESSLCTQWVAKDPNLSSCGQRRLWSDWADAQADLSLRWAHMPLCWFRHEVAQLEHAAMFLDIQYLHIKGNFTSRKNFLKNLWIKTWCLIGYVKICWDVLSDTWHHYVMWLFTGWHLVLYWWQWCQIRQFERNTNKCIRMGITLFRILICQAKSLVVRLKNVLYISTDVSPIYHCNKLTIYLQNENFEQFSPIKIWATLQENLSSEFLTR